MSAWKIVLTRNNR